MFKRHDKVKMIGGDTGYIKAVFFDDDNVMIFVVNTTQKIVNCPVHALSKVNKGDVTVGEFEVGDTRTEFVVRTQLRRIDSFDTESDAIGKVVEMVTNEETDKAYVERVDEEIVFVGKDGKA